MEVDLDLLELSRRDENVVVNKRSKSRRLIPKGLLYIIQNKLDRASSRNPPVFTNIAFNRSGKYAAAIDKKGNIYLLHLISAEELGISLVSCLGVPCLQVKFSSQKDKEFLVSTQERIVLCFTFEGDAFKKLTTLKAHNLPVHIISYHPLSSRVVTGSFNKLVVWNTDNWHRMKILSNVTNIIHSEYTPRGDILLVAFRSTVDKPLETSYGGQIIGWGAESYEVMVRLSFEDEIYELKETLRVFAVSGDNKHVLGGTDNCLLLWELHSQRLVRAMRLPKSVNSLIRLEFLRDGDNAIAAVLGDDGIVRLISLHPEGTNSTEEFLSNAMKYLDFAISSPDKRFLICAVSSGALHIIDLLEAKRYNAFRRNCSENRGEKVTEGCALKDILSSKKTSLFSQFSGYNDTPEDKQLAFEIQKRPFRRVKEPFSRDSIPYENLFATILSAYGLYPDKHRCLIWRSLLMLPENHEAYTSLKILGPHHLIDSYKEKFPIKSRRNYKKIVELLSCLLHKYPFIIELTYLPRLLYPFVKVFVSNNVVLFELCLTLLLHWCQLWLNVFPHPPVALLSVLDEILLNENKQLHEHLRSSKITSETYMWIPLSTAFSEVLSKSEWLIVWDNIFTRREDVFFFPALAIAYNLLFSGTIMRMTREEDFEKFFRTQNAIDVKRLVLLAEDRIVRKYSDFYHKRTNTSVLFPLPKGNSYPSFEPSQAYLDRYAVAEVDMIKSAEEGLTQLDTGTEICNEEEKYRVFSVYSEHAKNGQHLDNQRRLQHLKMRNKLLKNRKQENIDKMKKLVECESEKSKYKETIHPTGKQDSQILEQIALDSYETPKIELVKAENTSWNDKKTSKPSSTKVLTSKELQTMKNEDNNRAETREKIINRLEESMHNEVDGILTGMDHDLDELLYERRQILEEERELERDLISFENARLS